jgi:hypothetical protein
MNKRTSRRMERFYPGDPTMILGQESRSTRSFGEAEQSSLGLTHTVTTD